jgi:hypothetical protein
MGDNLNPYGDAIAANGTSPAAILAIGPEDSDGDGFSNDDEITGTGFTNIPTFPGLTQSNVSQVSGVTPSDLTGFLVPVADAECASDDDCDDGLFCNGVESCSSEGSVSVCVAGTDPCEASQTCDDDIDECVSDAECASDDDCADDLFCNGDETCVDGECEAGTDACAVDDICLEDSEECVECLIDDNCAEGEICEDDVCVEGSDCPEIEDIDLDGNCLLSKAELKLIKMFYKALHKEQKTKLKVEQKEDKDHFKYLKAEYSE